MRNLDAIIEKCIADNSESRYQNIEEIENYQIKIVEKEKSSRE